MQGKTAKILHLVDCFLLVMKDQKFNETLLLCLVHYLEEAQLIMMEQLFFFFFFIGGGEFLLYLSNYTLVLNAVRRKMLQKSCSS